jgi:AraC family transcriptional regulator
METLFIKNMVCQRCLIAVKKLVDSMGLQAESISLGEIKFSQGNLNSALKSKFESGLLELGFELIDDKKSKLIEDVKSKLIQMIHHGELIERKYNWSTILSEEFQYEYNYISNLFSSIVGITLEQYIILQKIEKVKELLFYDELSLSEIAYKLGYSSVAHLSAQFKKVTGLTPSALKKTHRLDTYRKPLDSIC